MLLPGQAARGGIASAAHGDRLPPLDRLGAPVDTSYPVAVVGAKAVPRNHLDQPGDDRRVRAAQSLDRNLGRAGARLGAPGKYQSAQGDNRRD
jgi:hypothetical protein